MKDNATRILELQLAEAQAAAASLGHVIRVLASVEHYGRMPLSAVLALIAPPLSSRQYGILQRFEPGASEVTPRAVAFWASVSDEVDQRLTVATEAVELAPHEWISGAHKWIIEVIGQPDAVAALESRLVNKELQGCVVKKRIPNGAGGWQAVTHE